MVNYVWSSPLTRLRVHALGKGPSLIFASNWQAFRQLFVVSLLKPPKKIQSCSVGDNALAFNHCQRGIFPEDSETASLWSQAAFLDVDSDGKTSQFWSTSSTGLGCITMYPCPPAIFDHHFPLVSWGPGIYLYTATCVWAYVSRDVKGQLVSLLFTFQGRSPKYWSPVIVNLTANRWVTFQKGIRISCPK